MVWHETQTLVCNMTSSSRRHFLRGVKSGKQYPLNPKIIDNAVSLKRNIIFSGVIVIYFMSVIVWISSNTLMSILLTHWLYLWTPIWTHCAQTVSLTPQLRKINVSMTANSICTPSDSSSLLSFCLKVSLSVSGSVLADASLDVHLEQLSIRILSSQIEGDRSVWTLLPSAASPLCHFGRQPAWMHEWVFKCVYVLRFNRYRRHYNFRFNSITVIEHIHTFITHFIRRMFNGPDAGNPYDKFTLSLETKERTKSFWFQMIREDSDAKQGGWHQ